MKNFLKVSTLIALICYQSMHSQKIDFQKYAVGLSLLTAFALEAEQVNEVFINDTPKDIKWVTKEDGYTYTSDIENIHLFGYKIIHLHDNSYIMGVHLNQGNVIDSSYLLNVSTTNNSILLNNIIAGGNSCSNAVMLNKLVFVGNTILYSTYINPKNIINWYDKAYDKVNFDCSSCCVGFSNYSYNVKNNINTLKDVVIIKASLPTDKAFVRTFNEYINARLLKESLTLTPTELKLFIKHYKTLKK